MLVDLPCCRKKTTQSSAEKKIYMRELFKIMDTDLVHFT